jgi:hypothetical protein
MLRDISSTGTEKRTTTVSSTWKDKDVQRYLIEWFGLWMQYGPWLSQPREIGIFTRQLVLLREITWREPYCLSFAFVDLPFLNNQSILNILDHDDNVARLESLLGILNSRLMSFYYKEQAVKSGRKIFPKVVVKDLGQFLVPEALSRQDRIIPSVRSMQALHKQLASTDSASEKGIVLCQINDTNSRIDQLVYKLYGLADQEIALIENSTSGAIASKSKAEK